MKYIKTFENQNPKLVDAARFGEFKKLKDILRNGADVNTDYNGRNAIFWAVYNGNLEMVKYLINSGANVDDHILTIARGNWNNPEIIKEIQFALDANKYNL